MLDFVKMSAGLLSLRDMAFNFWTKINLTELVRGKSQVVHHEVIIHVSLQIMVNAFELLLKFLVDLIKLVILVLKNALDTWYSDGSIGSSLIVMFIFRLTVSPK